MLNNNYMDKIRQAEYRRALDAYTRRVENDPESAEGWPFSPEYHEYKENMLGIGTSPLETRESE